MAVAFGCAALCAQQQQGSATDGGSKTGKRNNKERPSKTPPAKADKNAAPDAKTVAQNIKSKDEQEGVKILSIPHVIVEPITQRSWVDWLALMFDGLLVVAAIAATIVGILTFRAIGRQTAATEAQTRAVVRQAEANEESTEAMINSERAWVVVKDVSVEGFPHIGVTGTDTGASGTYRFNLLTLALYNAGGTVARLTGPLCYRFDFLPNTETLPDVPNSCGEPISDDAVYPHILGPGETSKVIAFPMTTFITEEKCASIVSGGIVVYFYASLIYRDTFEKEREVRCGYSVNPKGLLVLIGNKEYNKNT